MPRRDGAAIVTLGGTTAIVLFTFTLFAFVAETQLTQVCAYLIQSEKCGSSKPSSMYKLASDFDNHTSSCEYTSLTAYKQSV